MPRIITAHVPGAVTVIDGTSFIGSGIAPIVVGSPPQWDDGSDGSYAYLKTFEHPDVSYTDYARGTLEQQPSMPPNPDGVTVTARLRYQSMDSGMKVPRVYVVRDADGSQLLANDPVAVGSTSATTIDLPLTPVGASGLSNFVQLIRGDTEPLYLQVHAPFLRVVPNRESYTKVFEVSLLIGVPTHVAPPCRLTGRGDSLGVGAGRNYPPSKMQQTSSRGVGAY